MRPLVSSIGVLAIALAPAMLAQDSRTVVEPRIPAFCATLDAHLTAINDGTYNTLAPADESKLDTERIQKAIDSCGKGKAVALQVHGASNAFLSGPLELREGVTLVVDKGATLFETLDPAVMETAPGSCGVVATGPGGCKPLITVDNVSGAGVMGDGISTAAAARISWARTSAPGTSASEPSSRAAPRKSPASSFAITPTTSPSIASRSGTPPTSTSPTTAAMASPSGASRSIPSAA